MQSYILNNLLPDEKIIHSTKLHWINYRYALAVALAMIGIWYATSATGIEHQLLSYIPVVGVILTALFAIKPTIDILTTELAVTNKRVIVKRGFIAQDPFSVRLNALESVDPKNTILGRILGYGTLVIIGNGGTKALYNYVSLPIPFSQKALECVEYVNQNKDPAQEMAVELDPAELEKEIEENHEEEDSPVSTTKDSYGVDEAEEDSFDEGGIEIPDDIEDILPSDEKRIKERPYSATVGAIKAEPGKILEIDR